MFQRTDWKSLHLWLTETLDRYTTSTDITVVWVICDWKSEQLIIIGIQLKRQKTHECLSFEGWPITNVFSYASTTFLLPRPWPWPWPHDNDTDLDVKFLGQDFRKLEHDQDRQTDRRDRVHYWPHRSVGDRLTKLSRQSPNRATV